MALLPPPVPCLVRGSLSDCWLLEIHFLLPVRFILLHASTSGGLAHELPGAEHDLPTHQREQRMRLIGFVRCPSGGTCGGFQQQLPLRATDCCSLVLFMLCFFVLLESLMTPKYHFVISLFKYVTTCTKQHLSVTWPCRGEDAAQHHLFRRQSCVFQIIPRRVPGIERIKNAPV